MFSPDDFKLSFSTWAAPDQTLLELVETARQSGYVGIELRMPGPGGEPHRHGVMLGLAATELADVRHTLADGGVEISCISTALSFDGEDVEKNVEELKRHVTLAEALGSKCVRVFGGSLLEGAGEIAGAVDAVSDAISEAVAFAEQTSVSILLETIGDFGTTKYVREVAKQVYSEHFGVLWDVARTALSLETVEEAYDNIGGQVRHVHVHDFRYVDGRAKTEPAALGEGIVPVGPAIRYLAHDGYEGYISVETRLGPPDETLPQHAEILHRLITEAFPEDVAEPVAAE